MDYHREIIYYQSTTVRMNFYFNLISNDLIFSTYQKDYPVASFSGRKQFIISTTSWMGGKNPFLGWSYIAVGTICFLICLTFLILDRTWKM